jgi:glycosyltransferase involved in cell wall biosynthesis
MGARAWKHDMDEPAERQPIARPASRALNVAYAYEFAADDVNVQSGHPFFILDQLEKKTKLHRVFPLDRRYKYAFAPKLVFNRFRGRIYRPDREPLLLKSLAAQIERRLKGVGAECIFSPSSCATSFLDVDMPKIFCADATFAKILGFYDEYSNCAPDYLKRGEEQEARALATCAAAIYPSDWAARSAVEDYGTDPRKVHVVPFGANADPPACDEISAAIERKSFETFHILFIGRDWPRKGGDIVLKACRSAVAQGVPLHLDIVGLDSVPEPLPAYATNHGLLRKNDPVQRTRLELLLMQAHLMFVPSRAEAYGMTFCEAAAYGVPSLTSDVGGIPTIVQENVTGYSLPASSPPEAYADVIATCVADRERYIALAKAARRHYDEALNWDVFGDRLTEIMRDCLA